ncbi:MAG: phosphatase PAP2 family protein [Streptosporangiales bacterium]|nr:phosphatase PAP2 family protein [Streptosporangiales bacterium]MBO0890608.1 phosphatase PAP2 family protein [Acidothermales bacterium]
MTARLSRTVLLLVLAVAQLAGVVALHRAFVRTVAGRYVDAVSLTGASIGFAHIETLVHALLDIVSVASIVAAVVVIAFLALLRRRYLLATATTVLVVGAIVTTELLKLYVFSRPAMEKALPDLVEGNASNTLPSGHTTVALSVAVAFVLVVPSAFRGLAAVAGAGYAALTGVATLSAQWHRPSDVVAACLVVGAWAAGVAAVAVLLSRHRRPEPMSGRPAAVLLGLLAVVALAVGAVGLVMTKQVQPSDMDRSGLLVGYAGGAAAIVGACAAVVTGTLAMAPWVAPERGTSAAAASTGWWRPTVTGRR